MPTLENMPKTDTNHSLCGCSVFLFFCVNTGYVSFYVFCTDDMLIKLWNWDKNWQLQQVFEGHTHYVMQVVINPKDNNQFASASLDRTIKVNLYKNKILYCLP